jgi:PAS domain S-box-containing protein
MRKPALSTVCAGSVILICLIVLSGWQFDVVALRRLLPWAPPTTPLTVVILGLLSLSLINAKKAIVRGGEPEKAWSCYGFSIAVLLISVWAGGQYIFAIKPGLELLLYSDLVQALGGAFPGRPSPHTVITALFMGAAIGLSPRSDAKSKQLSMALSLLGIMLPWLVLFGYASLSNPFYELPNAPQTGMSPLTALGFILLGVGVNSLRPSEGLTGLFTAKTSAGHLVRRIMPVIVLAPLLFGWVIIYGREQGFYDASFGIALRWGLTSLLFAGLLLWQSFNLHRVDLERRWAFAEHEQMIQVMAKEREKFRNLLELAPDAMIIANEAGEITMVNAQAVKLFGYDRREMYGQPVEKLIPQRYREGHPAHRSKYHALPHARPMGGGMELFGLTKDNVEIPVEVSLNVLATEEGRLILAAIRDVSAQKQAREQIKKANAVLKQQAEALEKSNLELQHFAYVVSHDLQTPLRSISGFVQLLQQEYGNRLDEQAKGWIQRTVLNTQRMQTLIRDILAYSHVEARVQPFTKLCLGEVFNEVVDILGESIRDSGAEVKSGNLPAIMGDRPQMVQLLQNLIGNAIKYRGEMKPMIEVSAKDGGKDWVMTVTDNGMGIAADHFQRIFDVFQRLHTQKAIPGTGIGLAICRRVVERHGGKIWLESEPGQGSSFHFTVPKTEEATL